MTHDELLERVSEYISSECDCESCNFINGPYKALRAVVELHKNNGSKYTLAYGQVAIELCEYCRETYPCPTIQAIEKELQ